MATLPVLPLAESVLLPGMVIPVTLDAGRPATTRCWPYPASTASTGRSASSP